MGKIRKLAAVAVATGALSVGADAACLPSTETEQPKDDERARTAALECDPVSGECADIPSGPVYAMRMPGPDDWPWPWPPECPTPICI